MIHGSPRFSQSAPFLTILHVLQQKMSGKIGLNTMQVFHMVVQAMEHINNHLKLLMASLPLQLLSGLPPPYSAPPYFLPHLHIFEKYGQLSHEMNITCRVYSGKWMETASQG
jgi:hypothetical protein